MEGSGEPGAAGEAGWQPLPPEGPAKMRTGTLVEEIAMKLDIVVRHGTPSEDPTFPPGKP